MTSTVDSSFAASLAIENDKHFTLYCIFCFVLGGGSDV